MSYYESAEGIMIDDKRALQELRKHGFGSDELAAFHAECAVGERFEATTLLAWLGY